jgi:integrase
MPSPPPSEPGVKVVRRRLADGTVKEYRYARGKVADSHAPAGSVAALLAAFKGSPEWKDYRPATQTQYRIYLKPWEADALALVQAKDVSRRMVLTLRDAIAAHSGNGAATAFGRITSAMFGWAVDRGWMDHSPATRLKPLSQGILPAWSEYEISQALARLSEPFRRVVVLGLYTGQRRGDLISMTWGQVEGGLVRVKQQKTGAKVVMPVHPILALELEEWGAADADAVILRSPRGKPWTAPHLTREMGLALKEIGLPDRLNIHGLRKAASRRLAEAGCTPHEIAAITGHKTLAMVQFYTESVDKARLADTAMRRLENDGKTEKTGKVISLITRRKT